jgi:peptidoglycan L-alanyl-D-glutamate endopeptidase CwlK
MRYNGDMEIIIVQNPASICPREIFERLVVIPVSFCSFGDGIGEGSVVIDRELADDIKELFERMFREKFSLQSVIPVSDVRFGWDDEQSMRANNTSAFNYRAIAGVAKLSNHARGRAIDINPFLNPEIRGGVVRPQGAAYDPSRRGTITADSFIVSFLKERGWTWGGDWTSLKDYQHFEKSE